VRNFPALPPDLKRTLDALAHGQSRRTIGARATAQSQTYRAGGGSQMIAGHDDALAYAFVRMPATFAATCAVLDATRNTLAEFHPATLLDVGAGPGTAAIAAAASFPSVVDIRLIDANVSLRALALVLMSEMENEALRRVPCEQTYRLGDALALLPDAEPADLVIASYTAGEIADGELARFTQSLWAATAGALAVIEPGTPAGYGRIMRMRGDLIAAGAHVAAPCPHARACPLQAPDWCHFAQRLPRSRDHLRVKGAAVPFEDEKFSYMVLSRAEPRPIEARVLAPPKISKIAATAKLCTDGGVVTDVAARRDHDAYRRRKTWRWGDGVAR
jgi:ribosomal protein RSM22 (predicted rRNA methylase)